MPSNLTRKTCFCEQLIIPYAYLEKYFEQRISNCNIMLVPRTQAFLISGDLTMHY